jgi:hypothetical protein
MALQELVDFREEAIKGTDLETYTQNVNQARVLAMREYTAAELRKHQEEQHQRHPTEYDEQAPTYQDLFGRRREDK